MYCLSISFQRSSQIESRIRVCLCVLFHRVSSVHYNRTNTFCIIVHHVQTTNDIIIAIIHRMEYPTRVQFRFDAIILVLVRIDFHFIWFVYLSKINHVRNFELMLALVVVLLLLQNEKQLSIDELDAFLIHCTKSEKRKRNRCAWNGIKNKNQLERLSLIYHFIHISLHFLQSLSSFSSLASSLWLLSFCLHRVRFRLFQSLLPIS